MNKSRTIIFSMIPVFVLLVILEIVGRYLYPFDPHGRAQLLAKRDLRTQISPFENASGKDIMEDIFGMEKRYLTFLGFLGKPNTEMKTLSTNEIGFRDGPVSSRTDDEFRILLLGGSTAWGWGASSNDYTVAGALENLLNEGGADVRYRVMNGAYHAWTSLQERITLMEFYDLFDPDLVISLSGFNDLISVQYGNSRELLRLEFGMLEKAVENNLRPMGTLTALRKLIGTSGIWRIVVYFKELSSGPSGHIEYSEDRSRRGIPKVVDRYTTMADYAGAHGAKYMLALQPVIYTTKKSLTDEETRVKEWVATKGSENMYPTYNKYHADLLTSLKTMNANGVSVIDLSPIFDDIHETVFLDDCHFNDSGYLTIAKYLRNVIVQGMHYQSSP